jgi:hypothetical protein
MSTDGIVASAKAKPRALLYLTYAGFPILWFLLVFSIYGSQAGAEVLAAIALPIGIIGCARAAQIWRSARYFFVLMLGTYALLLVVLLHSWWGHAA